MARLKPSRLAGSWYAADREGLRRQVDALLEAAAPPPAALAGAAPEAVVVPHAGYVYSGRAAASAYRWLRAAPPRRAVLLAPSHFAAFRGAALLDVDAFATPLGEVAVDAAGVSRLRGQPLCRVDPEPYGDEHSLEIQLPLLQRALPGVAVVPVLLGSLRAGDEVTLAAVLRGLVDADTVFVVSSDFVHYGRRFGYLPFAATSEPAVREGLRALDMGAIRAVCAADAAGFDRYVAETGATICGRVPIRAFLTLHRRRTPGTLLTYYTSLDVTHDYEHCVSYASIAFPCAA